MQLKRLHLEKIWKRACSFSFFILNFSFNAQILMRNSDGKLFDEVLIKRNQDVVRVNKDNLRKFNFDVADKVLYDDLLLDFMINQDTLLFFDDVREIPVVEILSFKGKRKVVSPKKSKRGIQLIPGEKLATYLVDKPDVKTYIKAIELQVNKYQLTNDFDGTLVVQILGNKDGIPNDMEEIEIFSYDLNDLMKGRTAFTETKVRLDLPKVIKFPEKGFFISIYVKTDRSKTLVLSQSREGSMYRFTRGSWVRENVPGFYYQLIVLQKR